MKKLVIIGARGCGREVLQWVKDINKNHIKETGYPRWEIKGFLDDDVSVIEGKRGDFKIISSPENYSVQSNDEFICCIGDSKSRKMYTDMLKQKGAVFVNIIHPTAIVSETANLGNGIIIYPYAIIGDNAEVSEGCLINSYSDIAHDTYLGQYCTLSPHCCISGRCVLGDCIFMGTDSCLVPNVKIGNDAYICAGSTVMTNIKDAVKVIGTPAKKINL